MSTRSTEQFENDLAQLLRAGGDAAPDLHLDTGAVIDQGHRAVRRARLVRGAAGLAAAAVIAVGGYAVLTGGVDRAGEFTPATPSPSVTAPVEKGVVTAQLSIESFHGGTTPPSTESEPLVIDVSLDLARSTGHNLTWSSSAPDGGVVEHQGGSLRVDPTTAVVSIPIPELRTIVTIEPASTWMTVVQKEDPGAEWGVSSSANADLGSSGLEVRAFRFQTAEGMAAVTGFVRGEDTGAVFDDRGDRVDSGRSSDGRTFFWSDRLDTFGFFGADGAASTWISAREPGDRVALSTGRGGTDGIWTVSVDVVVEAGATDPVLRASSPGPDSVPGEAIPLGGTRTVLTATYESDSEPPFGTDVMTWTDPAGVVHEEQIR